MLSDVAKPTHLFRVLEVLKEGLLVPGNTLVHVGSGVGEAIGLTGLAAENTARRQLHQPLPLLTRARATVDLPMEVGADLVRLTRTNSMALGAAGLEESSTLGSVTYKHKKFSHNWG